MTENNHQNQNIPDFFIVGAPKCGTTSLYYWLNQHPEIFMCSPKEPKFFGKDFHQEEDRRNNTPVFFKYRELADYTALFQGQEDKFRGDATTYYLYSREAPEEIKHYNPGAKIIIVVREPFSFLKSYHSQMLKHQEDIKDFKKALEAEEERKQGKKIPKENDAPSILYYKELARFSKYIERYQRVFPSDQLKLVLFDDLKNEPKKVYRDILEFIGVFRIEYTPDFKKINSRKEIRSHFLQKILRNARRRKSSLRRVFPEKAAVLYYFLKKRNFRSASPRTTEDEKFKQSFQEEFKPEIRRLSRILGRDLLRLWGYDS